jgi:anthranilate synthase component 2
VKLSRPDDYLFQGIPEEFMVCRYHSWAVESNTVNGKLVINSIDEEDIVMGLSHIKYDVRGLQFHPESILTENGKQLINNWLMH